MIILESRNLTTRRAAMPNPSRQIKRRLSEEGLHVLVLLLSELRDGRWQGPKTSKILGTLASRNLTTRRAAMPNPSRWIKRGLLEESLHVLVLLVSEFWLRSYVKSGGGEWSWPTTKMEQTTRSGSWGTFLKELLLISISHLSECLLEHLSVVLFLSSKSSVLQLMSLVFNLVSSAQPVTSSVPPKTKRLTTVEGGMKHFGCTNQSNQQWVDRFFWNKLLNKL